MKRTRLKKVSRATLMKRLENTCDELWSKAVKVRDGHKCRWCGATEHLNSHHIIRRGKKSLRWDTANGITLCRGCHKFKAHAACNLDYWVWLEGEIGRKQIDWLRKRGNEIQFVTYEWLQDIEQQLRSEQ